MKKLIIVFSALLMGPIGFSQTFVLENFSTFTDSINPPPLSGWKNIDSISPSTNQIWRFDNVGNRTLNTPISNPAAILDSDRYGNGNTQDAYLFSPSFDASNATTVVLEFDHYFLSFSGSFGEIQIFNGSNWVSDTIFTTTTNDPQHEIIDISQYVAGVANAQVRFRYYGTWGYYWILDNVNIFQPAPDDAAVVSVDSTMAGCGLDSNETIVATLVNVGSTTFMNFPINYTINGGPIVSETVMDSIVPGDTLQYSFTTKANFSTVGTYNIDVFTTLRGDNNNVNDTANGLTVHKQTISTFPYTEGFENGNGGWIPEGPNSSWAVGTPTGSTINAAATGSSAYVTNLSGNYNDNDASFVLGPCFDFSTLSQPQIRMNIWYESESSWDGAVLEMSINNGATWTQVGAFNDPNNWYNDNSINALIGLGLSGDGWTIPPSAGGGSGGWVLAKHALTGAANQPSVQFRIWHASDGVITREGFAFDDILIQDAPPIDAGLIGFNSPVSNCSLSAADSVCILVSNFGSSPIQNFPVEYRFNGQTFSDTVRSTINPGDTTIFCFNTTINVATPGNYTIEANTALQGDADSSNDSLLSNFDNIPIISTFPYSEGFENGNGGWVSGGINNSWMRGTPAGSVISSAANGSNAYVTNLTGNYNNNEESYVVGPCFDFTNLALPQIKLNVWWSSENSWDGAVLQSSIDGGASWQKVGDFNDPNNWYNDNSINGLTGPNNLEPSGEGWSGSANSSSTGSGFWVLAEHDLNNLGGQSAVILRVAFGSDGSVIEDGFGFDDVLIQDAPPLDAAADEIVQPESGCGLSTTETLELRVINNGSDTLSFLPAVFEVNNNIYYDTLFASIFPGDTAFILFDSTANLSTWGDYTIKAYTNLPNDGNSLNDTTFKIVTSVPTVNNLPYSEGFEGGTGGWITSGMNSSWERGTPAGSVINTPAAGSNSYVTNLSGNYNVNELSYLESPCFDLTNLLVDPILRFSITYEFGFNGEAWIEQSINGGATWTKITDNGGALNWYNNTNNQVWENSSSGGSGAWSLAENTLNGLIGQSNVKFRFVMDGDFFSTNEGIGIDNVYLDLPAAIDGGVINLISPTSACGLGAADTVSVQLKNFGQDTLTSIPVSYQLNNGAIVTETINTQFFPGDSLNYKFTMNSVNLAASGIYNFKLFTGIAMDGNATNDTIYRTIENTLQTAPYIENFDLFSLGTVSNAGWKSEQYSTNIFSQVEWLVNSGGTPSFNTGPSADHTTGFGNYVYTEFSNGNNGDSTELYSPCIDLGNVTNPRLSFFYHKYGGSMADLYVDIYDGSNWINAVDSIMGQVQTANADTFLLRDTTSLMAYAGNIIQVRFRTSGKIGFASDMAIDDFRIYGGPVSIDEIDNSRLKFSIYPNPNKGQFTLKTPKVNGTLTVDIRSATGQLVYENRVTPSNSNIHIIDLNNVAKGVYFVRISDKNNTRVEKLIIN